METTKNRKTHKKNNVVKSLLIYTEKIKKLNKQYSELNDEVKSLKRDKYSSIIYRILFQISSGSMIQDSLKEETENLIEWAKIILSKFQ